MCSRAISAPLLVLAAVLGGPRVARPASAEDLRIRVATLGLVAPARAVDLASAPGNPSTVYVAAVDPSVPSRAGVYVSDDLGRTWHRTTRLHCAGVTAAVLRIEVNAHLPSWVRAIGECEVAESDDGGVTWHHAPLARLASRAP